MTTLDTPSAVLADAAPTVGELPIPVSTMRAAVITEPGAVEIRQASLPEPDSNEVRVRIESCGVCASNVPPWEGRPWFTYPMEPGALGHEATGWIDAVGSNVTGWAVGQRVAMLSYHGYAEYDVANASALVALPPELGDQLFPGEPLGCAMNIFRRSEIKPGDAVAIIGVGFLGSLLVQLASRAGARVIAIARKPQTLELARSLGAAETIPMVDSPKVIERVMDLTNGRFCDVVIEAVGKQPALDLAGEITRERGRLVVAGFHQDGPRQINMQLWNWRGIDVVNAHERDPEMYVQGIRDAVAAVVEGRINPSPLLTHRLPLDRLGEALELTRHRPEGFMKAVVLP